MLQMKAVDLNEMCVLDYIPGFWMMFYEEIEKL
jgi:hypothetical protein